MGFAIQDLKAIRDNIASTYKIDSVQAARVVGFYNVGEHKDHDTLNNMLLGDLSPVPAALSALGISSAVQATTTNENREEKTASDLAKKKEEKTAKRSPKNSKNATRQTADNNNDLQAPVSPLASSVRPSDISSDKIPADNIKDHTKDNIAYTSKYYPFPTREEIKALSAESPQIEIMQGDELPPSFGDTVEGWFESFANKYNFDIYKLHPQQWRAACMYVGENIKASGVIRDRQKEKHNGGKVYSPHKLEELLKLWAYFCGLYRQVPLASDYINFSGVHRNFFYDYDGQGLSSTAVHLAQKAKQIEEAGLGSSVAGGGAGTVGGIFLLKARHGYSETVTVNHVSAAPSVGLAELPKLTTSGDLG